jgi:hypothetical protein
MPPAASGSAQLFWVSCKGTESFTPRLRISPSGAVKKSVRLASRRDPVAPRMAPLRTVPVITHQPQQGRALGVDPRALASSGSPITL